MHSTFLSSVIFPINIKLVSEYAVEQAFEAVTAADILRYLIKHDPSAASFSICTVLSSAAETSIMATSGTFFYQLNKTRVRRTR